MNGQKKWYVGYMIDVNEGMCTVEHMERVGQGNREWRYPAKEDICQVDTTQVVSIQPTYMSTKAFIEKSPRNRRSCCKHAT